VTTTDEILALVARRDDGQRAGAATAVTQADIAAFRAASARGSRSAVVRALLRVRPFGDPAWTAWLAAAAAVAADEPATAADERPAAAPRPVWCAVFGAAVALADRPGSAPTEAAVTAAIAAGLGSAAIVESGLAGWGGWSSGTVVAVIGAGVTAGLLLGLTEPGLRAAIGICATQAAGLRAAAGTDALALQVGKAAFNGVEAALLAQAGLTAPVEPLDGRRGLFALFGG
jgi:2-methylcitrate dehydratase PrpD